MNYLTGKNQEYYEKHSKRSVSRTATAGERLYSRSWLAGFNNVWNDDGVHVISHCKTPFEVRAFQRGQKFATKVISEK